MYNQHTTSNNSDAEQACVELLKFIQEDPSREGLRDTPKRFAKAFKELTSGYSDSVESIVGNGLFTEECSEMVIVRDIEFYSLCEHHLLPFFGRAHVAYLPAGRLIGLSKIPRIVKMFARRLQVQERLTTDITSALTKVIAPRGVACSIEARHMCMMMRGIQVQSGSMVTHSMVGDFLDDHRTRNEFLSAIHHGHSKDR